MNNTKTGVLHRNSNETKEKNVKTKKIKIRIDGESWLEICNIGNGAFWPLQGFMDLADYTDVVEYMHLNNGSPWTMPVTLDIPEEIVSDVIKSERVILVNSLGEEVADLFVEDVYKVNFENDIKLIFGTDKADHPGVKKEINRSIYRLGGPIKVKKYIDDVFPGYNLTPAETKKIFKDKGWTNITGFQTRNPIHRAHEYLQKIAIEITDGIFIQPLIGWKKDDDFSPLAVITAYEKMLKDFYPANSAVLGTLRTPMRYAGPREAVFHAIIRRNYGCTHFIVGRDHAGVGGYYGKYDAHKLCNSFDNLGIKILTLYGPYYCKRCLSIVTERTCPHGDNYSLNISGTQLREMIRNNVFPPPEYMRKEISDILMDLSRKEQLFVGGV
jgi:sulfate adenylyltransferase